ncbi:MAG: saccharopine dehydrogenase family protein [Myxococcaceae bacterium]|nr:MAG: saccharopine dehydrogenase family protein [Myxococcaceae bacterium]
MKHNVLILGAGGVARVVAHQCARNNDVLGELHLASRTRQKCEALIASVHEKGAMKVPGVFKAHGVDAMSAPAVARLIRRTRAQIVINVASPFVNDAVLVACLRTGAAYLDTAAHEHPDRACEPPPWYANYEWRRRRTCEEQGVTAILGVGFDPGVVNAYVRLAADEYLDTVESIDIVDVNAGSHGRFFATNFDPETNFREFTGPVYSWQQGRWGTNSMFEVQRDWDLPVVGRQKVYLTGHDEVHSLSLRYPRADVRFWMGFSDHYIQVFTVLKNLGLLSEHPVRTAEGLEVVPLKVVKAVLPDPASLAPGYTGKTCIGDRVRGMKNGLQREVFLYNVSDHPTAYASMGSQAIAYTAGIPPVAAAMLIASGAWDVARMVNVEELPPRPFLALLERLGLPTRVKEGSLDGPLPPVKHDYSDRAG